MEDRLGVEEHIAPAAADPTGIAERDGIFAPSLPDAVKALIDRMMDGTEVPYRPFKDYEVKKFNPAHINICTLRAAGFKVKEVAEIMGYDPQRVYQTMMHPYAKMLIKALTSHQGAKVFDIRTRLEDYAGELMDVVFAKALQEEDLDKAAKVTFGFLDRAGYTAKESSSNRDKSPEGEIKANATVMNRLASAMEGSNAVSREVMPTWTPRRPPEEAYEQEAGGSASVGAEVEGGPSSGADSSDQPGSHRARGVA